MNDFWIESLNFKIQQKKIKGLNGIGDRYFFEKDFIHFVDMMGSNLYLNNITQI